MTQTADAIEIDTTHMTLEEVIDTLEELAMRCER
jgi:cytidylate kinase